MLWGPAPHPSTRGLSSRRATPTLASGLLGGIVGRYRYVGAWSRARGLVVLARRTEAVPRGCAREETPSRAHISPTIGMDPPICSCIMRPRIPHMAALPLLSSMARLRSLVASLHLSQFF